MLLESTWTKALRCAMRELFSGDELATSLPHQSKNGMHVLDPARLNVAKGILALILFYDLPIFSQSTVYWGIESYLPLQPRELDIGWWNLLIMLNSQPVPTLLGQNTGCFRELEWTSSECGGLTEHESTSTILLVESTILGDSFEPKKTIQKLLRAVENKLRCEGVI